MNLFNTKKFFTRQMFGYCAGTGRNTDPVPYYADIYSRRAFGLTRSHDAELHWAAIETSPGVYDWSKMDKWIMDSMPKWKMWTIEICPSFYASSTPATNMYWPVGSNTAPNNWAAYYNFILAGLKRYAALGINIVYVEIQNEVNYVDSNGKRFWDGTNEQLAECCYWAKKACTDAGTGTKVISPSLTNLSDVYAPGSPYKPDTLFNAMIAASDGHGGTMDSNVDCIGVHLYGNDATLVDRINYFKSFCGSKPVINTENGCRMTDTLPDGIEIPYQTELQLLARYARIMIVPLAFGIPSCAYQIGKLSLAGKYSLAGHPAMLELLNQLIMRIVNKGIDNLDFNLDGSIDVTIGGIVEHY